MRRLDRRGLEVYISECVNLICACLSHQCHCGGYFELAVLLKRVMAVLVRTDKQVRLYLGCVRQRWMKTHTGVQINLPEHAQRACSVALFCLLGDLKHSTAKCEIWQLSHLSVQNCGTAAPELSEFAVSPWGVNCFWFLWAFITSRPLHMAACRCLNSFTQWTGLTCFM